MLSDVGLLPFLATVVCFQLVLTVDPAATSYSDSRNQHSADALQRPYPANPLNEPPTLTSYYSYKGVLQS